MSLFDQSQDKEIMLIQMFNVEDFSAIFPLPHISFDNFSARKE